jgi:hypothetical protein
MKEGVERLGGGGGGGRGVALSDAYDDGLTAETIAEKARSKGSCLLCKTF